MSKTATDPNLLFGVIAVQMNIISRDDLNTALADWAGAPGRSLAQVLRDRQALTAEGAAAVESVLREHLGLQRDHLGAASDETLAPTALSPAAASDGSGETLAPQPSATSAWGETLPPQPAAAPGSFTPAALEPTLPPSAALPPDSSDALVTLPPSNRSIGRSTRKIAPAGDTQPGTPTDTADQTLPPADRQTHPATTGGIVIGPTIPGYKLLGELGRGGMGVVFKAQDVKLNRVVALKMILSGDYAGDADLARFRLEAEAVAKLQHPNIVQVFATDECDGKPYFSLEFVDGGPLDQKLGGDPLPPRQAAELLDQLARAMHYAHQRDIIHRDLKPANVLLTKDGQPKITDFGLAKKMDDTANSKTQGGTIMGTPSYMAPEQALGKAGIGPPADIYSLGAILYEFLTGRPPFKGATVLDTLEQVRSQEPVPPSRLQPKVPKDLETICLKCLEKDPKRRYADCQALAGDLRRWLEGEPILARPLRFGERFLKLTRRRPALVAAWSLAVLVVVLVIPGTGVTWLWQRAEEARAEAEEARAQAEAARGIAEQAQLKTEDARRELAQLNYIWQMDLAHREWQDGNVVRTLGLLQETDPTRRRWEWGYLNRLCHAYVLELKGHIRANADTKIIALSTDGKLLAVPGDDQSVKVWDTQTAELISSFRVHTGRVLTVAFSPDGERIVSSADGEQNTAIVWNARTGEVQLKLSGHSNNVGTASFSPDGRHVATGSYDNTTKVWDAETGAELRTLRGPAQTIRCVAFSPDGKHIATACGAWQRWDSPQELHLWDARTGEQLRTFKGHTRFVSHVTFSPDGKRLASTSLDATIKVWDAETGQSLQSLRGHNTYVWCVNFSQDGKRIVSAGEDQSVKVWDVQSGQVLQTFMGHTKHVRWAAFSPDGKRIYSASDDQTLKVWDSHGGTETTVFRGHNNSVFGVAFAPDSKSLASASADGLVKIWDLVNNKETLALKGHSNWVFSIAYSPDGKRLASSSSDRTVKIWDVHNGQLIRTLSGHTDFVQNVAFSPDGKRVASVSRDLTVRVWDVESGQSLLTLRGHTGHVYGVCFSPEGKRIASAARDSTARVWDVETGVELFSLIGHSLSVWSVDFSPDGQRIATACDDATVRIWDARTGSEVRCLRGHKSGVGRVAFSPDGERVASSSGGDLVLWDVQIGHPILKLKEPAAVGICCLTFSPNGKLLASGSNDRTVKVRHTSWDH